MPRFSAAQAPPAALAPSREWLIGTRLVMGFGLEDQLVIRYSMLGKFVSLLRGRWIAYLALITNIPMAASALAWYFVIPAFGWRVLFAVAGAGALLVWWAHKNMLESPRWLESVGRFDEAGRVMTEIEAEIRKALPGPASGTRETSTVPVELRVLFSVVSSAGGCSDDKYSQ